MPEYGGRPGTSNADVIAMALSTCRIDQGLMKGWTDFRGRNGCSLRRANPDVFEGMTGDAVLRRSSTKGRMAVSATVRDLFVPLDDVAWTHGHFGKPNDQRAVGR